MAKREHLMAGGPVGDMVDMGGFSKTMTCTALAACWVRAQLLSPLDTAPTAPSATPAPASGAEAAEGWKLLAANGQVVYPADATNQNKGYRYVEVWELASGYLTCEGV